MKLKNRNLYKKAFRAEFFLIAQEKLSDINRVEEFGSLTVGYQKKVPAGRIKPAFFVSNFWFLSIVFYCNVL